MFNFFRKKQSVCIAPIRTDNTAIYLSNWQVAHMMVADALNHAEANDMETVIQYLSYIELLLQKPEEDNINYPINSEQLDLFKDLL